jgi:hypothetical protein
VHTRFHFDSLPGSGNTSQPHQRHMRSRRRMCLWRAASTSDRVWCRTGQHLASFCLDFPFNGATVRSADATAAGGSHVAGAEASIGPRLQPRMQRPKKNGTSIPSVLQWGRGSNRGCNPRRSASLPEQVATKTPAVSPPQKKTNPMRDRPN